MQPQQQQQQRVARRRPATVFLIAAVGLQLLLYVNLFSGPARQPVTLHADAEPLPGDAPAPRVRVDSDGFVTQLDTAQRRVYLAQLRAHSCASSPVPRLEPCSPGGAAAGCVGGSAPADALLKPEWPVVRVPVRFDATAKRFLWRPQDLVFAALGEGDDDDNNNEDAAEPANAVDFAPAVLASRAFVDKAVQALGAHVDVVLVLTASAAPVALGLKRGASVPSNGWQEPSRACCAPPSSRGETLGAALARLAVNCTTASRASPHYALSGSPHFGGGTTQLVHALERRGWVRTYASSSAELLLTACHSGPKWDTLSGVLVSATPGENSAVNKRALIRAVRNRASQLGCDYVRVVPESFLLSEKRECEQFLDAARASEASVKWFLKSPLDSFGRGVTVATPQEAMNSVHGCKHTDANRIFAQRGVDSLELDGRRTQGRAYLFVSAYQPFTVFFKDGYFNVAGAEGDSKEAMVTNLGSNQRSLRYAHDAFFNYLNISKADAALVRARIKEAFLTMFLSLDITRRARSFTLFGVDFIVDKSLGVRILEANCNCELFADPKKFGRERVEISTHLVRAMIDAVLVTNLAQTHFADLLQQRSPALADAVEGEADLLYSEAVEPPWTFAQLLKCYPSM